MTLSVLRPSETWEGGDYGIFREIYAGELGRRVARDNGEFAMVLLIYVVACSVTSLQDPLNGWWPGSVTGLRQTESTTICQPFGQSVPIGNMDR